MSILGSLIGGGLSLLSNSWNNTAADNAADEAWDRQKKVLTNQIQWRVADTVKAGLHPLAALGVNPASGPAAAQVGGVDLGQFGQDLGNSIEAKYDPATKISAAVARLELERGGLENELLRTQIASQRMRLAQQGTPGIPGAPGSSGNVNPFTGEVFGTKYPGLGQNAENDYSDVGGNIFGGAALVADWAGNNGINPRDLYRDPVGTLANKLLKETPGVLQDNFSNEVVKDAWWNIPSYFRGETAPDTEYNWGY